MAINRDNPTPWDILDSYRGKVFEGEWPTIPEMFDISAMRYPENRCFECFSPKHILMNYSEVRDAVLRTASFILEAGAVQGDRIAVMGKNSPEWGIVYLAALYAGCIIVPLDASLKASEAAHLLRFAGVKVLFADSDKLESLEGTSGLLASVSLEDGFFDKMMSYEPLSGFRKVDENDAAAILFTSGTTGTPKGVTLSHRNLIADCWLTQGYMNVYPSDAFYAVMPIHHAYTMLAVFIEGISSGAAVVFGKSLATSRILKELRDGRVTMLMGVPMLYNKFMDSMQKGMKAKGPVIYGLLSALMGVSGFVKKTTGLNPGRMFFSSVLDKAALKDVRICISGGGPLPAETFRRFNEMGVDFVQGYGLTETSPIINLNPIYAYRESSVGKTLPMAEEKIVDPDENGNGLIYIRGPMVMKGYWENPEATAEILDPDGWLNTGDVGHLDSENYLVITGRAKSVIVNEGGKNIFPEEIEDLFQLESDIEQILVTGYPLQGKGNAEGVKAIIYPSRELVSRTGGDKDAIYRRLEEIVGAVNGKLAPYKRITRIQVISEPMEMTGTKKIKRLLAAEKYRECV